MEITLCTEPAQIERCFPVLHELRPHVASAADLRARVQRQAAQGYRLACLEAEGAVRAVAGFRIQENLAWGRFLYVDDLVTASGDRSRGHGDALLDWLAAHARAEGCQRLELDSGVQRDRAHRFYFRKGLVISCHHFAMPLLDATSGRG